MTEWKVCPECGAQLVLEGASGEKHPACPKGHYTHYNNPTPAVIVLIVNKGTVLLLKRARQPKLGIWDSPGGFMEAGELPEETARREVSEETTLLLKELIYIGSALNNQYGNEKNIVDLVYEATPASLDIKLSNENSAAEWFPIGAPPEVAFPSVTHGLELLKERHA